MISRIMMPLGVVVYASGIFFVIWLFGALLIALIWAVFNMIASILT
ncbi:MAG: hypothetical protein ACMG6H_03055 [Acidobacteriota bacterium]